MRTARPIPWPALAIAGLLALAPHAAFACALFTHFTTDPAEPNDQQPTVVQVFGCAACAEVVDSRILAATQVEVVLRYAPSCLDTAGSWSESFDLGVLPAGRHNLLVTVRNEATPWLGEMFGTWFEVSGETPPPPPPPPITQGPLFSHATTDPAPASTAAPTVMIAHGVFPYPCGFASDSEVLSPSRVQLTLRRAAWCAEDSVRTWLRGFLLGLLPAGTHEVEIRIRDAGGEDSLAVHEFSTTIEVLEAGPPDPPLPPPDPVDSLRIAKPNPFRQRAFFSLTTHAGGPHEVGVFDLQGRQVRTLFRGWSPAGTHEFAWDGRRDDGSRAAAGVYFYRVTRPGGTLTRRVVLLPDR